MRRVTPTGPRVVGGQLVGGAEGPIAVGSAAWHAFLTKPGGETRAFTFPARAPGEWHRAYREWRRPAPWQPTGEAQPYWYVRVRIGAKVRRFYLGPPAAIDGVHLAVVAAAIADARGVIPRPEPEPLPPLPLPEPDPAPPIPHPPEPEPHPPAPPIPVGAVAAGEGKNTRADGPG